MKESGLEGYEYFAYISYCDEDAAFAKKLQRHLEKYKLPVLLSRQYPRTPRKLTPVFRDDLPQSGALARTKFLIPICTETSARVDEWGGSRVDAEVHDFVTVNPSVNRSRVIPIIYRKKDGARATACIPAAVKALDLLALDVLDKGYEQVCNQLVSRMVGIKPGILWNRWLRKARKNMAILAAISFTILLAALVAIGGGPGLSLLTATLTVLIGVLCAHWYTTPRIAMFERFIEANNLPVGIRKISAKQALCRAYHYRFTYRGFRLVKVECCNSSGVPLPQQRPGFTHDEVACMELFYNERGQVNRQHWFDEHGMPLREVLFEQQDGQDWVNFRSPGGDFADSHLLTKKDGLNSPVTRYQVQRNPQGHITEVHYCNTTGALCADCDGTWGRRYDIDASQGLVTARYYLNQDGVPMNNSYGVAGRIYEYNDHGHMFSFSNVDVAGNVVFDQHMIATIRCRYDNFRNRTEIEYFSPEGILTRGLDLTARKRYLYDSRGFIISEIFSDEQGNTCENSRNFARCDYTRNSIGTITSIRYFNREGAPCQCSDGYHQEEHKVDEYGNSCSISYFDIQGNPCLNQLWAHHIINRYDIQGRLIHCRYLNERNQPTYCSGMYHAIRYTYDQHNNLTEESYYGTDEQLCRNKAGVAKVSREYDFRHNCKRESYFSPKQLPCLHAESRVSSTESCYDENNNKVSEHYYDTNHNPCRNRDGITYIEREFNANGHIIAETFKNADGFPIANKQGIARITMTINQQGFCIKKKTYGLNNKKLSVKTIEEFSYGVDGLCTHQSYRVGKKKLNMRAFDIEHSIIYKYNANRQITELSYMNSDGEHICDKYGVSSIKYGYNRQLQQTHESYYSINGSACKGKNGAAAWIKDYDAKGFEICHKYYDTNGNLCMASCGYAKCCYLRSSTGKIAEVRYFGADDNPININGYSVCSYTYDKKGNLTSCCYYNASLQKVEAEDSGISSFSYIYDADNNKISESYYGTDGALKENKLTSSEIVELAYDELQRLIVIAHKNAQGKPCTSIHGYSHKTIQYNTHGEIIRESYFGSNGELILNKDGYAIKTSDYDSNGNILWSKYYDINRKLINLPKGYCRITYHSNDSIIEPPDISGYSICVCFFDSNNNCVKEEFQDSEGNICEHLRLRYAQVIYTYDANGNELSETFYNKDGHPTMSQHNYAKKFNIYDAAGKILRTEYRDTAEKLCNISISGYSIVVYSYDERGNVISKQFFDKYTHACMSISDKYANISMQYNNNNALVEETYYDTNEQLTLCKGHYARLCIKYDDKGNKISSTYYNENGEICTCISGYAEQRYQYTPRGQVSEILYYDTDGNLKINSKGYARLVNSFNEQGDLIQVETFDTQGNLCCNSLGYARCIYTYDNEHILTERRFYGSDGKPCFITDKFGKLTGKKRQQLYGIRYRYTINDEGKRVKEIEIIDTSLNDNNETSPSTIHSSTTPQHIDSKTPSRFDYFAFISYSSKDVVFANKLQKYVESFRLPSAMGIMNPHASRHLKPIFRDRTDLEQGNLNEMLMRGLKSSKYLLVICSENSAKPNRYGKRYIDMEVNSFIELNPKVNKDRVIPIIYRKSIDTSLSDCIPPAVREHNLNGIDVLAEGKAHTFNRVVSQMAGIDSEELWKYCRTKRNNNIVCSLLLFGFSLCGIIAGGIYIGIIIILCCVIMLISIQRSHRTRIIRYASFTLENNLPVGTHELTKKETSQRASHYRFIYRGYHLKKVIFCNSFGTPIQLLHHEVLFPGASTIELFYNENDNITHQIHTNADNKIIRKVRFHSSDQYEWIDFLNPHSNHPMPHKLSNLSLNTPVTRYRLIRNTQGAITKITFCNKDGMPCQDSDGTWGCMFNWDEEKGCLSSYYYLDNDDKVMLNQSGIAGCKFEYDHNGNLTTCTYLDCLGLPTSGNLGYSTVVHRYDTFNNRVETNILSPNGTPAHNAKLIATEFLEYNQHGFINSKYFLNTEKERCLSTDGYSRVMYAYNSAGLVVARSYFKENDTPCLCTEKYHRCSIERDLTKKKITTSYYGINGAPCRNNEGIHRSITNYDSNGNLISIKYFDISLNKTICRKGYHILKQEFDTEGHLVAEETYDTNDLPCCGQNGVCRTEKLYDNNGNCIHEAYFDENKIPCLNRTTGSHALEYRFDEDNKMIFKQHLGINNSPCHDINGISSTILRYNELGFICEEIYQDIHGRTIMNSLGIAGVSHKYSHTGDCIERADYQINYDVGDNSRQLMIYRKEQLAYDEAGNVIARHIAFENIQSNEHHSVPEYHITYEYDSRRNLVRKCYTNTPDKPRNNDEDITEYCYNYNSQGLRISESFFNSSHEACKNSYGIFGIKTKYDEYGHLSTQTYLNANGLPCISNRGYAGYSIERDINGYPMGICFLGIDGKPITVNGYSRIRFHYNQNGNLLWYRYETADNLPTEAEDSGVTSIHLTYNSSQKLISISYRDKNNAPVQNQLVMASIIEFDYTHEKSEAITITYKDSDGKLVTNKFGYSKLIKHHFNNDNIEHYDHSETIEREEFYNTTGLLCMRAERFRAPKLLVPHEDSLPPEYYTDTIHTYYNDYLTYSQRKCSYWLTYFNENGNEIKKEHYGYDGQLQMAPVGYARLITKYDEDGRTVSEQYYDEHEQLCIAPYRNYARIETRYNADGKQISVEYYGVDNNPCLKSANSYSKLQRSYNKQGQKVNESYYDCFGLLCLGDDGYAKAEYHYDANGNETCEQYCDINGKLCQSRFGYAIKMTSYNHTGLVASVQYYDKNSSPCEGQSGYGKCAQISMKYNDKGLILSRRFYGVNQTPILVKVPGMFITESACTWEYDDHSRVIKESHFDTNEQLFCVTDRFGKISGKRGRRFAYAVYHYTTDESGNEVKHSRYYDEHGNEVT